MKPKKENPILKINDWTFGNDSHGWTALKESYGEINPKTGKPKKATLRSYHATFRQALEHYVDIELKPCDNVLDMLKRLDTINDTLNKFFNENNPSSLLKKSGHTGRATRESEEVQL